MFWEEIFKPQRLTVSISHFFLCWPSLLIACRVNWLKGLERSTTGVSQLQNLHFIWHLNVKKTSFKSMPYVLNDFRKSNWPCFKLHSSETCCNAVFGDYDKNRNKKLCIAKKNLRTMGLLHPCCTQLSIFNPSLILFTPGW